MELNKNEYSYYTKVGRKTYRVVVAESPHATKSVSDLVKILIINDMNKIA